MEEREEGENKEEVTSDAREWKEGRKEGGDERKKESRNEREEQEECKIERV